MVTVAVLTAPTLTPPPGLDSVTVNASSPSGSTSSTMPIGNTIKVSPSANVSVPVTEM
jgi:hypothetical protein